MRLLYHQDSTCRHRTLVTSLVLILLVIKFHASPARVHPFARRKRCGCFFLMLIQMTPPRQIRSVICRSSNGFLPWFARSKKMTSTCVGERLFLLLCTSCRQHTSAILVFSLSTRATRKTEGPLSNSPVISLLGTHTASRTSYG